MYQVSPVSSVSVSTYYVHWQGERDCLFQGSLADCLAWITLTENGWLTE